MAELPNGQQRICSLDLAKDAEANLVEKFGPPRQDKRIGRLGSRSRIGSAGCRLRPRGGAEVTLSERGGRWPRVAAVSSCAREDVVKRISAAGLKARLPVWRRASELQPGKILSATAGPRGRDAVTPVTPVSIETQTSMD